MPAPITMRPILRQPHGKLPFVLFLSSVLASLGQAAQANEQTEARRPIEVRPQIEAMGSAELQRVAQVVRGCQYGGFPQYYSRVTTNGDSLRIRATPAGRVIGAAPNGWSVVVLEWSRNGVWARITSHFGDVGPYGFASAEYFRDGWVSAAYLKDLGRFCDKPPVVGQRVEPELFGEAAIEVQGDWLALGDALAKTASSSL